MRKGSSRAKFDWPRLRRSFTPAPSEAGMERMTCFTVRVVMVFLRWGSDRARSSRVLDLVTGGDPGIESAEQRSHVAVAEPHQLLRRRGRGGLVGAVAHEDDLGAGPKPVELQLVWLHGDRTGDGLASPSV